MSVVTLVSALLYYGVRCWRNKKFIIQYFIQGECSNAIPSSFNAHVYLTPAKSKLSPGSTCKFEKILYSSADELIYIMME